MATKFYLRDAAADINPDSPDLNKGLLLTAGAANTTAATDTVAGPVTPAANPRSTTTEITKTAGGTKIYKWISKPLNAVTITGNPTINVWGLESNAKANSVHTVAVAQLDSAGGYLTLIANYNSAITEYGTAAAVRSWTQTLEAPGSFSITAGQRIGVFVDMDDASAVTMASTYTVTLDYDGPTAAADGDTWVSFVETITEQGGAAPAVIPDRGMALMVT